MNLKIAIFHNLPSGGAKRALYDYVTYLNAEGHEIDVYVPSTANEDFLPLKKVANKVETFPVKNTLGGYLYSTLYYSLPQVKKISFRDLEITQKNMAEIINNSSYDLVFSEQDQYTMAPFFLKYVKLPLIYYCPQPPRNEAILQEISSEKPKGNLLKRFIFNYSDQRDIKIDQENIRHAQHILTNSYFTRESILRVYGLNSMVSYLGVDNKFFRPLDIAKEDFVLSVGSCRPSKGYEFLINSLGFIEESLRPTLVIVSNHSEKDWKDYLQRLAQQKKVQLEILEMIKDEELVELYNKALLVVYAPYLEPFGLVPLEAMACGTPVIAVKEGGVRETILHNRTGLHTPRDEKLFAEAVMNLLLDDSKRESFSKKGLEVVERFWTLKKAGHRLIRHFKRVLEY